MEIRLPEGVYRSSELRADNCAAVYSGPGSGSIRGVLWTRGKYRLLEGEAIERKQLAKEVESLRSRISLQEQEKLKLKIQTDELAARLYSHYEDVPTTSLDAWMEPVHRAKKEFEGVADAAKMDLRKAQTEINQIDNAGVSVCREVEF